MNWIPMLWLTGGILLLLFGLNQLIGQPHTLELVFAALFAITLVNVWEGRHKP